MPVTTREYLEAVQPLPGGDDLVVSSFAGVARVDAGTGKVVRWYRENDPNHRSVCWEPAVSADGSVVAAGFGTPAIYVWSGAKKQVGPLATPSIATRVTLTADGKTLVLTRLGKEVVSYDAASLKERWLVDLKKSFANGARIDPDGAVVAAGGTDGFVRIMDAKSGALLKTAPGNGWINDVDLRADRIATGGRGKEVRLYDFDGTLVRVLPFGRNVERVSLSHDGRCVVASSAGKYAATGWDTHTGKELCRLDTGTGVSGARFSCVKHGATGYRVAGVTQMSAAIWDVPA